MRQLKNEVNIATTLIEDVVDDSGNKQPEYYLEGVFLQANVKNRNGRIYPMEVMKPEVERYIREYVDTGRAYGQLNHPSDPKETPNINLEKVSHVITKIWQDGDYFKARAKILDTPSGRIVKAMINEHCQLGVSSRALGSVTMKNGVAYVNNDFRLITAGDIVWEPSAQTAFPQGLIEDVEWMFDPVTQQYVEKQASPFNESNKEQLVETPIEEKLESDDTNSLSREEHEKLLTQIDEMTQIIEQLEEENVEKDRLLEGFVSEKRQKKESAQLQALKEIFRVK